MKENETKYKISIITNHCGLNIKGIRRSTNRNKVRSIYEKEI